MKILSVLKALALSYCFLVLTVGSFAQTGRGDTTVDGRVNDLIAKMTLDEKLSLLSGTGFDTHEIKRLGIPALHMTDGPAGVRSGQSTSFPSGVALAATFDPDIVYRVGQAIAQEAKAKGKN